MRYNINVDKKTITVGMKEIDRMPDIKEGDEVCCVCGISTPRKEVEGDVHYFLDLVVLDIAKVTE